MNALPAAGLRAGRMFFAIGLLAVLVACGGKDKDLALLAEPAAGDLYAAEMSRFSEYDFTDEDGGIVDPAYGLLKVVRVDEKQVVVVTEVSAWGSRSQARQALRDGADGIQFDPDEEIPVARADLAGHYEAGRIFGVRR